MWTLKHFFPVMIFTFLPVALSHTEAIEPVLRSLDSKRPSPAVQKYAAEGVLRRLLPTHLSGFTFKIVSMDVCGGRSCFWLQNYYTPGKNDNQIMIKGTTAVDITAGLHWYLKYCCGAHISWDKTGGIQVVSVPSPGYLPLLKYKGILIQRSVPWSYYENVVTSSYSNVWWDWSRWEKEIDWMALQGVNLPLAYTGQEAIWQKVYMDFNITMDDLKGFFGGPAFLAWARMGNLHGWGGPISQNWLTQQLALQKQILARIVELGMTPVLPSFSGNVPAALKTKFSSANITQLANWNTINGDRRWCCTFLLNPSDPLFVEIGEAFIKRQVKEYGSITNVYNCDTFNENLPPTSDPNYISILGVAVYRAMSKGNDDAVWLMQGWLFSSDAAFWKPPQMKALLHSVPYGRLIVLDLFADVKPIWKTSSQFYGTPYIWCLLHNFGGNIEMYGILDVVSSGPVDAHNSENSSMVGAGMCMEGIEQNPVIYELMSEMAFRNEKVQVVEWLKSYSRRRYGRVVHEVETAWEILYHTVYNCTDGIADHNTDFIVNFPDWNPSLNITSALLSKQYHLQIPSVVPRNGRFLFEEASSIFHQPHLWYSTNELVSAWQLFLVSGKYLSGSPTYRYDLVDLTRQVLSKLANQVYVDAIHAFLHKDISSLNLHSRKFVQLIHDIDELLASNRNFLLGTWIESAKKAAKDSDEMRQYEWNARTQVTMWYDTTKTKQSKLHDYANKYWSGLLEGYYLPRASIYFSHLAKSLKHNEMFNLVEWRTEWLSFSKKWQDDNTTFPVEPRGDSLVISNALYGKYFR